MKHISSVSKPQIAVVGPGLNGLQQFVLLLTKGRVLLP